ncbi:MAG: hypothetical protein WKF52_00450 [Sphingomicrobium sp.]
MRDALRTIYRAMSPARRRQLVITLVLMVADAAAELLTIGAVLPVLALLARPDAARPMPAFASAVTLLGSIPPRTCSLGLHYS